MRRNDPANANNLNKARTLERVVFFPIFLRLLLLFLLLLLLFLLLLLLLFLLLLLLPLLLEPYQVLWVLLRVVVRHEDRVVGVGGGIVEDVPRGVPHVGYDLPVVPAAAMASKNPDQEHLLHAPAIRRRVRRACRVARILCEVDSGSVHHRIFAGKSTVESLLDDFWHGVCRCTVEQPFFLGLFWLLLVPG